MNGLRAVMDTNVLVAAFRSRQGASFELFLRLRRGEWTAVISNHLLFEYEEVLKRETATGLSLTDVDHILNAVCARSEEHLLAPGWEPILADADDEPLVQLAHESGAKLIVSFNARHLEPAKGLGISVLKPGDFLAMVRRETIP